MKLLRLIASLVRWHRVMRMPQPTDRFLASAIANEKKRSALHG